MTDVKRYGINWEEKLSPTEVGERPDGDKKLRVVLLAGLQRLAQEAGLRNSYCKFEFIQAKDFGIMQCIYTADFDDGTSWVGAADCNAKNTTGKFLAYPTAVAESRAEARCLRKALGIRIMSSEEVGFHDGNISQIEASPTKKIDGQVVKAIEKLCDSRNISPAELLEQVLDKERASSIYELSELTLEEGNSAMSWLNTQKPKAAKKTKAEERDERKKQLMSKTKEL